MKKNAPALTRSLIERLARLALAEDWDTGLNPTQVAALTYLARANRFSRSPSHVADYLGATRGTVSQTLKALLRKELVTEVRSDADRRSIRFGLTDAGSEVASRPKAFDDALAGLPQADIDALRQGLSALLLGLMGAKGRRFFGICRSCRHHERRQDGAYCRLLRVSLAPFEADQVCHEHQPLEAT